MIGGCQTTAQPRARLRVVPRSFQMSDAYDRIRKKLELEKLICWAIETGQLLVPEALDLRTEALAPEEPTTERAVILVRDSNFYYAGDVFRKNGRIYLTKVIRGTCWEINNFPMVLSKPRMMSPDKLARLPDMSIPESSEIACIPVPEGWGL